MGETNWLKQRKEGFKVETMKNMKSIKKKKEKLTNLPLMDNIHEPSVAKDEKTTDEPKKDVKEGFTNNVDFAYLELEKEMEDLGVKGVFDNLIKFYNGEIDYGEVTEVKTKGDRWCKSKTQTRSNDPLSLLMQFSENFDIFPALAYSVVPIFQYVIKKIVILYCDIVDAIKNDTLSEENRKLIANEFLRFLTAYIALFATYNWFFLWCFRDKSMNYLDESQVKPEYGKKMLENPTSEGDGGNPKPNYLNWKGFLFQYPAAGVGLMDFFFTAHTRETFNGGIKEKFPTLCTLPWAYEFFKGAYPLKFLILYGIFFIGMGCGSELIYDINYAPFEKFLKGLATPDRLNMQSSMSTDNKIKNKLSSLDKATLENTDFLMEGLPKAAITMIITFEVVTSLASSVNGPLKWFDYLIAGNQPPRINGFIMGLIWDVFRIIIAFLIFFTRVSALYTFYPLIYLVLVIYFLYHTFYSVFAYKPMLDDDDDDDNFFKYIEKIDEMVSLKEEKNGFNTAPCDDSIFEKITGYFMRTIRLGINKFLYLLIGIFMVFTSFTLKLNNLPGYMNTALLVPVIVTACGIIYKIVNRK